MVKVENNKIMSTILLFIRILYLKQQSIILQCFRSLKFVNCLQSNKFSSCTFRIKRIIFKAEKVQ